MNRPTCSATHTGRARSIATSAACTTILATILAACATSADMRPELGTGWCSDTAALTLASDGTEAPTPAEIRWIASDHEGAREASAAWCSVVGPPVVAPDPHPSLAEIPVEAEVVAGTWNVWVGAADLEAFIAEQLHLGCAEGEPIPGPGFRHFFLMLQEVHLEIDEMLEHV